MITVTALIVVPRWRSRSPGPHPHCGSHPAGVVNGCRAPCPMLVTVSRLGRCRAAAGRRVRPYAETFGDRGSFQSLRLDRNRDHGQRREACALAAGRAGMISHGGQPTCGAPWVRGATFTTHTVPPHGARPPRRPAPAPGPDLLGWNL